MEDFVYCGEFDISPETYFFIGTSFSFVVYFCLSILGIFFMQIKWLQSLSPVFLKLLSRPSVSNTTFAFSILGMVCQLTLLSSDSLKESLNNCSYWLFNFRSYETSLQWLIVIINVFFFIRVFGLWIALYYKPQLIVTIRDSWMFAHSMINVVAGQQLHAFQFIILHRCLDYDFRNTARTLFFTYFRCFKRTNCVIYVVVAIIGLLFVSAIFHSGEEFQTNHNLHRTLDGEMVVVKTYWSYVYFSVITLTGVGYGDIVMITVIGRILVSIFIVLFFCYFISQIDSILQMMYTIYISIRHSIHRKTSTPRIVFTGNYSLASITQILNDFLLPQRHNEYLDIIILGTEHPKTELKIALNSYWNVKYCIGNIYDPNDILRLFRKEPKSRDALIALADWLSGDEVIQDHKVYATICAVKSVFPNLRVIACVFEKLTKHDLESLIYWQRLDYVLCINDLIEKFLILNSTSPGSPVILHNMFYPCDRKYRDKRIRMLYQQRKMGKQVSADFVVNMSNFIGETYLMGKCLSVHVTPKKFEEAGLFPQAVLEFYDQDVLLIGYILNGEISIYPSFIPAGSHGLVLTENPRNLQNVSMRIVQDSDGFLTSKFDQTIQLACTFQDEPKHIAILNVSEDLKCLQNIKIDDIVRALQLKKQSVDVIDTNHLAWVCNSNTLEKYKSTIILNPNYMENYKLDDIETLYVASTFTERIRDEKVNHFLSVKLQEIDHVYHFVDNFVARQMKDLFGLGTAVSPQIIIPLISEAYSRPYIFPVFEHMSSLNEDDTHFVTIQANIGGNFENYFQKFLYQNYLLLGVYRLAAKNERERIAVTYPLKSFKVDKDDFLIALKPSTKGRSVPSFVGKKKEEEEEVIEKEDKKKTETICSTEGRTSHMSVASKFTTITSGEMTMVK